MKRKLSAISGQYLAALRQHLSRSPRPGLEAARRLGHQAMAIGLATLDLARIHERAIAALEATNSKDGIIQRADLFFAETARPFEDTDHAGPKASARLKRLNSTLGRRTLELTACNRSLKQEIAVGQAASESLKKSQEHYQSLLAESLVLQKHLQKLVRRVLSAEETDRKKLSHELQDEIGQTLLGINVRLLTVKKAASQNAKSLRQEIARTERLVGKSVKTIKRGHRE